MNPETLLLIAAAIGFAIGIASAVAFNLVVTQPKRKNALSRQYQIGLRDGQHFVSTLYQSTHRNGTQY